MVNLCLGTVQFGMRYGVNNQIGRQPTRQESFEMLDYAIENGIDIVDTAAAYGEAESILGEYFRRRKQKYNIKIISKLKPNVIEKNEGLENKVIEECKQTLKRLSVDCLDGYLLHTPEYIYNEDILEAMQKLKKDEYVRNIGISIYDLKEGYAAIKTGIIDYIQLPYSILDQRGIKQGFISEAQKAGIKVFTRSAFLQGLFMMDKKNIPKHLRRVIPYLEIINKILEKYNVDKVSVILEFIKCETDIDYLVFGVETKEQLKEDIFKFSHLNVPKKCIDELKLQISNVEQSIIFPSLWSNGKKA